MKRALPTGTVTFFFSDIEGSTKLTTRLGSAYTSVLEEHDRRMRGAFEARGGVEVRTIGDAFFVVFPTADAAVHAAVAAQHSLAEASWPEGVDVKVRMGINTGVGELGGGDYVGVDVVIAARIAAVGHGGQLVISDATKSLLRNIAGIELRELGEHRLKDVAAVRLWQVSAPGLPQRFPPLASLGQMASLPPDVTPFVGREREIADISALVRAHRLVTLTGPGGTGKTRLSLKAAAEIAAELRDGAAFVPLAAVSDPSVIPQTIAEAISLPEDPSRPVAESLTAALRDRDLLLVLDNFEQLVAGAGAVSALLKEAPKLRCLVTTREPLHLYGEREYPVPVLAAQDAMALFADRARAVRPSFALTPENEVAVLAIFERLDRLPLAIELGAARVKFFTPEQILERLDRSLALLISGARDLPERQRTLRGAIAWSHDLLSEPERVLFRRLSVFVGAIPLPVVPQVCDPRADLTIDPLDGLASLLEKSLLGRIDGAEQPHFTMLVTIREFGAERLDASGEADTIRGRHAASFMDYGERLEPDLVGENPAVSLDALELAHDNVRAALAYSAERDVEVGLRLGAAAWRFWLQRSHLREGREWLERLLALPTAAPWTLVRGRALTALGGIAYWQGDFVGARRAYEESLRIFEALGTESHTADAQYNISFLDIIGGDPVTARDRLERSVASYRRLDDRAGMAKTGEGLVAVLYKIGEYTSALPLQEEVVATYRAIGSQYHVADGRVLQAAIAVGTGDLAKARACLGEAIEVMTKSRNHSGLVGALILAALVAADAGDPVRAARLFGAAQQMRADYALGASPLEILGVPNPGEKAKAALGEEPYAEAYLAGTKLSSDSVLAEAGAI